MALLNTDDLNLAARYSLRHYVPFSYYARSPEIMAARGGVAEVCVCSAFVMKVGEMWCLVTAGHVLDEIDAERRNGLDLASFRLWDGWAAGAQHRGFIPFDYDTPPKIRLNRDGLDYGLIPLGPLCAANLAANRVEPIGAAHYAKDWPDRFDGYRVDCRITPLN
jgi:hypothetical protein